MRPQEAELPSKDTNSGKHFLPTLDGWRAVAILAVLVSHWGIHAGSSLSTHDLPAHWVKLAESFGPQGVNLFFAISGYLITTLLLIEREKFGRISLKQFYIRRSFRILPPILVFVAVLVLLSQTDVIRISRNELLSVVFFYNNYLSGRTITQEFWSLSMEEHFYFIWPFLVLFLRPRHALWVCLAVAAATLVWRPWALVHTHLGEYNLQRTDLRLDAFMYPCALAIISRDKHWRKWLQWVGSRWALLAFVGTLLLVYAVTLLHPDLPLRTNLIPVLMPFIILSTVLNPFGSVGWILNARPLAWLGRISYGVYIWHPLLFFVLPITSLLRVATLFPVFLALVLAVSAFSFYFIEKPLIGVGRKLAKPAMEPAALHALA